MLYEAGMDNNRTQAKALFQVDLKFFFYRNLGDQTV
jgi:hypothetical protein